MGFGDALIAAGCAQSRYDADSSQGPIAICDPSTGRVRWHYLWRDNPAVFDPATSSIQPCPPYRHPAILCGDGRLPYLQYPCSARAGWRFSDWRVCDHRPRLTLRDDERALGWDVWGVPHGTPFLLLEPTSTYKTINRRPPHAFWVALLSLLRRQFPRLPIVQLAHVEAEMLPDVIAIPHKDFREACGVLSGASLLVTTEGGLVHAAAALGVPAVVLWGGCISVESLGYPEHLNIVDDDPQTPCGQQVPCNHCADAWRRLTPEQVVDAVQKQVTDGVP